MLRYACECGTVYEQRVEMCCLCFSKAVWPMPATDQRVLWGSPRRGLKKATELRKSQGQFTPYRDLDKLPKNWKMLVYGAPGGGKTTFSLLMGDGFENGLYVGHEEGENTIAEKVRRLEISNLFVSDASQYTEIVADLERIGDPEILVLDSITSLNIDFQKFSLLSAKVDRIVGIAQICKDGSFAGTMGLAHYSDIVLEIAAFEVRVVKNRFGKCGSFPVLVEESFI